MSGGSKAGSAYERLPANISAVGLVAVRPKQVWIAVMLALLFGPMGLIYCTLTGTVVMSVVSLVLMLFVGRAESLMVLPICAVWAWRAARESASLFD